MLTALLRRLAKAVLIRRPRRFDVLILGRGYPDWDDALAAGSAIWTRLPARSVVRDFKSVPELPLLKARRRFILPLREDDYLKQPRGGWGLQPSARVVRQLGDKREFWRHMQRHGLTRLTPETWTEADAAQFPAVLKRIDAQGGQAVVICPDTASLTRQLQCDKFRGKPFVIQRYIDGPEFTLHAIVVDGRPAWATAYRHGTTPGTVRVPRSDEKTDAEALSAADLADLAAILTPVGYCGQVNIDFKRGADGRMLVMEINPRFGGSLFRTQNRADLAAAIAALGANARWLGRPRKRK